MATATMTTETQDSDIATEIWEPKIVAFLCNWCSYTGADLAGISRIQWPANVRIVRIMCSGRLDPTFVVKALTQGADGVLIAGCHPGDCHYSQGNYNAMRRAPMLMNLLEDFGIERPRVRQEWISASEGERFAQVVREFMTHLRNLGPLNWEKKVSALCTGS